MTQGKRAPAVRRAVWGATLAATGLLALGVAYALTYEPAPEIRILWRTGIAPQRRAELERQFLVVLPRPYEDRLAYDLLDTRRSNIEAIVRERDVANTDGIRQADFAVPADHPYGMGWMWIAHRTPGLRRAGVVEAVVATCLGMLVVCIAVIVRARHQDDGQKRDTASGRTTT